MTAPLQPPTTALREREPEVLVRLGDPDPEVEAAIDRWLLSLLDSPTTPGEVRGSKP